MVAKRFDNVKTEMQAKTGRTWDQIQDMRSRVNFFSRDKYFSSHQKEEKITRINLISYILMEICDLQKK